MDMSSFSLTEAVLICGSIDYIYDRDKDLLEELLQELIDDDIENGKIKLNIDKGYFKMYLNLKPKKKAVGLF